jgi:hypothetical protein
MQAPAEEFGIEKRRLGITTSGLELGKRDLLLWANGQTVKRSRFDVYRGRILHSIKSIVPLAAFHQLEILLFLHRCPPSLTDSAPSALLITADLPTFM